MTAAILAAIATAISIPTAIGFKRRRARADFRAECARLNGRTS
jgi:hypothetical protein